MTLELEGLTKVYKDKTALDDVSFFIYTRHIWAFGTEWSR